MENSVMARTSTDNSRALRIAVCVLTYKRSDGLSKLLDALGRQVHDAARPYALSAVVVDNDASASARAIAKSYAGGPAFELIYVVEPNQGIPLARNRALVSVPPDTDLVCFIDDDEWPVDNWLDAMLAVYLSTDADCVYGPVAPVYPSDPPEFFIKSRVFERKRNRDGAQIGYAASNNVMIDYRFVREHELRFEEKMRFTGGTDYRFFYLAVKKGMRIFWAENALVYDIIPESRMTWKWVLQRQFRLGNTFAVTDAMDGSLGRRAYRLAYGACRVGLGVAMLPALLISPYWGMRSLTHILRGAGAISGILGHSYQEYAPARLRGT
jgi:glycosyltransferase involved in cell wall biosynthesis